MGPSRSWGRRRSRDEAEGALLVHRTPTRRWYPTSGTCAADMSKPGEASHHPGSHVPERRPGQVGFVSQGLGAPATECGRHAALGQLRHRGSCRRSVGAGRAWGAEAVSHREVLPGGVVLGLWRQSWARPRAGGVTLASPRSRRLQHRGRTASGSGAAPVLGRGCSGWAGQS